MNLKININDKEYSDKLVQGVIVSEEYNETLDSATVILSQIPKIEDLRPYDDIFIYEGEFKGYGKNIQKAVSVKEISDISAIINLFEESNNNFKLTFNSKFLKENSFSFMNINISLIKKGTFDYITENYSIMKNYTSEEYSYLLKSNDELPEFKLVDNLDGTFTASFNVDETGYFIVAVKDLIIVVRDADGLEEVYTGLIFNKYKWDNYALANPDNFDIFNAVYIPSTSTNLRCSVENPEKIVGGNIKVKFKKYKFYYINSATPYWLFMGEFEESVYYSIVYNKENVITLKPVNPDKNMPTISLNKIENEAYFHISSNSTLDSDYYDYQFIYELLGFENFNFFYKDEEIKYDGFYKHFLVDQYVEEMLNIDEDPNKILYKYKIELFSETKRLETVQIPNFSVTQPQHGGKKKSVYSYIIDVVDMYSPYYKVSFDNISKQWTYKKRYTVDESLKEIFENIYCPDFTLNNPHLRDVLAQLMLVADRIPYVVDDVIYAMDITERKGDFDFDNGKMTNFVSSLTSSNYCDNLKRTYSNALSQDNSSQLIERLGFRNSSAGMLTLENMRLETRFPVYKINKMYMCYYKRAKILSKNLWSAGVSYIKDNKVTYNSKMYKCIVDNATDGEFKDAEWEEIKKECIFLCKQDVTKLFKLNSERNLLSQDWTEFIKLEDKPKNIDEMAEYKLFTIGYDIGTTNITGFGEKYEYFVVPWWDATATYLQNIFTYMDYLYPYGIYETGFLSENVENDEYVYIVEIEWGDDKLAFEKSLNNLVHPFKKEDVNVLGLKSLFFEMDYNAFYNGTIYHSKDNDRDDIVINDNSSSSLTLLEQDGIHQKEKANRFGNKSVTINARYTDINDLQKLGSVVNKFKEEDVIIYHRQYSIFDNVVNCSYSGTKDYVLKNYFTSVYAKHRPYNLMSYGESVRRSENRKMYVMLSKNKKYVENENKKIKFENFYNSFFIDKLFSFYKSTENFDELKGKFNYQDKINYGYFTFDDGIFKNYYLSDVNSFVSGNSICFNLAMYDNVSGGVYLDKEQLEPDMTLVGTLADFKDESYIRGSKQKWYLTVDDEKEGHVKKLGFYVGHSDNDNDDLKVYDSSSEDYIKNEKIKNELFALPRVYPSKVGKIKNIIGDEYILNKDNKELIDFTFQVEVVNDNKNEVFFSPKMLQLSDLIATKNKFEKTLTTKDVGNFGVSNKIYAFTSVTKGGTHDYGMGDLHFPTIVLSFLNSSLDFSLVPGVSFNNFTFMSTEDKDVFYATKIKKYGISLKDIKEVYKDENGLRTIIVNVKQIVKTNWINGGKTYSDDIEMVFKEVKGNTFGANSIPIDTTWFTNVKSTGFGFVDGSDKIYYDNGNKSVKYKDDFCVDITSSYEIVFGRETFNNKNVFNTIFDTYSEDEIKTLYEKNLFLTYSEKEINSNILYKQFLYNENDDTKINDDIIIDNDNLLNFIFGTQRDGYGPNLIVSIPDSYKNSNIKSIQVWFLDNDDQRLIKNNVYYFVFGINISDEDKERGYVKINASVLSSKDMRVFNQNHTLAGKVKNVANSSEIETEQKYEEQQ